VSHPTRRSGTPTPSSIGASVDATGVVNADTTLNLFRVATVTVSFPLADGTTADMDIETVLADLS
jgi:hypothetical protein